jgi:hypothetical protein
VRNRGEGRLAAKPTKRDLAWSDGNVRQLVSNILNSDPTGAGPTPADAFLKGHSHLPLDTADLTGPEAAGFVLGWLDTVS